MELQEKIVSLIKFSLDNTGDLPELVHFLGSHSSDEIILTQELASHANYTKLMFRSLFVKVPSSFVNTLVLLCDDHGLELYDIVSETISHMQIKNPKIMDPRFGLPLYKGFPNNHVNEIDVFVSKLIWLIDEPTQKQLDNGEYSSFSCGHNIPTEIAREFNGCPVCQSAESPRFSTPHIVKSKGSELVEYKVGDFSELVDKLKYEMYESSISRSDTVLLNTAAVFSLLVRMSSGEQLEHLLHRAAQIPSRELKAMVHKFLIESRYSPSEAGFDTVTDVLRLALLLGKSVRDIETTPTDRMKFTLKRKYKTDLVRLLDKTLPKMKDPFSDVYRNKGQWIALLNTISPTSKNYKKYGNVLEFCTKVRSGEGKTFNSIVEEKLANGQFESAISMIAIKPGEFVRSFARLYALGGTENRELVLNTLKRVLPLVDSKLIINLYERVRYPRPFGFNRIKGKFHVDTERSQKPIVDMELDDIIVSALCERFEIQETPIKVKVASDLMGIRYPLSMDTNNVSNFNFPAGARIPVNSQGDHIVFYMWWTNGESGRTDLDMSAMGFSDDFSESHQIAYYNTSTEFAEHSGDYTDAPAGATEYVLIDKVKAKELDVRYVSMVVNLYSSQHGNGLGDIENRVGLARLGEKTHDIDNNPTKIEDESQFEEVFFRTKLNTANKMISVALYDLETDEIVWADMSSESHKTANVATTSHLLSSVGNIITQLNSLSISVGEILKMMERTGVVSLVEDEELECIEEFPELYKFISEKIK